MVERGPAPEAAAAQCLDGLTDPSRLLLLAVSGGGDSMAMLLAFHRTLRRIHSDVRIFAATVDHGLRPEAADEAAAVGKFCAALGIAHRVLPWTGKKPASGIQAAARLARYRLLTAEARRIGAGAVLTAHTLDDQFETVLMRATRESGGDAFGAAGMAPQMLFDRKTWIVRPFLDCRREDLRNYLRSHGVGWVDDPSNVDLRFERVRQRSRQTLDGADAEELARRIEKAARHRWDRSQAVAKALDACASQWRRALFMMRDDGSLTKRVLADAVAELIGVAGGQAYPLAGPKMAMLQASLDGASTGRRLALSRCVVTRRAGAVLVWREDRGFSDLVVKERGTGLWDDRFIVDNPTDSAVTITRCPHPIDMGDLDVPAAATSAIAAAAASTLPTPLHQPSGPGHADIRSNIEALQIEPTPVIARYDTFLPVFEWTLASALARLLAVAPYPAAPLGTVDLDRMMRQ